jgi:hypothetical protein
MKVILATLAAAGIFALFTIPARADATAAPNDVSNAATATVEHTDVSARRRHWRHYGYRHRPYGYWGPRYGYYRPYRYAYGPGVSFGFWGGPRFGVWF